MRRGIGKFCPRVIEKGLISFAASGLRRFLPKAGLPTTDSEQVASLGQLIPSRSLKPAAHRLRRPPAFRNAYGLHFFPHKTEPAARARRDSRSRRPRGVP